MCISQYLAVSGSEESDDGDCRRLVHIDCITMLDCMQLSNSSNQCSQAAAFVYSSRTVHMGVVYAEDLVIQQSSTEHIPCVHWALHVSEILAALQMPAAHCRYQQHTALRQQHTAVSS